MYVIQPEKRLFNTNEAFFENSFKNKMSGTYDSFDLASFMNHGTSH